MRVLEPSCEVTCRPVLSKRDFVQRYEAGEFGNRAPTWNTLEEFLASGYWGLIHIRNRVAGGPTWYDVPAGKVEKRVVEVCYREGVTQDQLYFSGMAPTTLTLLQGEVLENSIGRLQLFYSTVPKPMRESLVLGGKQVSGLAADAILNSYLNPKSLGWLKWLLSAYPGHVVEFSCYSQCWGTVPGMNTVFWEIRLY